MEPVFDYSKLLGRIKEKGYILETYAKSIDRSLSTVSLKLSNKAHFTQKEMFKTAEVLDFSEDEIGIYFFTLKV